MTSEILGYIYYLVHILDIFSAFKSSLEINVNIKKTV